jgi:DNA-binding transcriptional regulator YiaG
MMSAQDVSDHLAHLQLSQADAARLLGVVPRTVSRWLAGEEVPGPVEQALRAWHLMQRHALMWRPDTVSITKKRQAACRNADRC